MTAPASEDGATPDQGPTATTCTTVTVEATDRHAALDRLLRQTLALAGAAPLPAVAPGTVAAPLRGEGDDLASLAADLLRDLAEQGDYFGAGLAEATLDGIVRRDDGGFVAWGYASGVPQANSSAALPELAAPPEVSDEPTKVVIRVTFAAAGE